MSKVVELTNFQLKIIYVEWMLCGAEDPPPFSGMGGGGGQPGWGSLEWGLRAPPVGRTRAVRSWDRMPGLGTGGSRTPLAFQGCPFHSPQGLSRRRPLGHSGHGALSLTGASSQACLQPPS